MMYLCGQGKFLFCTKGHGLADQVVISWNLLRDITLGKYGVDWDLLVLQYFSISFLEIRPIFMIKAIYFFISGTVISIQCCSLEK